MAKTKDKVYDAARDACLGLVRDLSATPAREITTVSVKAHIPQQIDGGFGGI